MKPTQIIKELRKIASCCMLEKDVCTQAANLIEYYREGLSTIRALVFDYNGYDTKNAEQIKGLVDEYLRLCDMILRGEPLIFLPDDFDMQVETLSENEKIYKLRG